MWERLVLGVFLAGLAYFVVRYFSSESFIGWGNSKAEVYGGSPTIQPRQLRGDMTVASGGPNSPNVESPSTMSPVQLPPPEAMDPMAGNVESADAPENLRHPENSFGPGIIPEQTAIASSSGIAGPPASSSQAFQQFGPELVSNGGVFFGGISAVETENPNYSAF
jgi:hypothetical protein